MFRRSRFGSGITASLIIASMFLVSFTPAGFIPTTQGGAPFVPGQIIVGMKNGVSPAAVARSLNASQATFLGGGRAYLLDLVGDPLTRAAQARAMPGVSYAEPNWLRQLHVDPNDPGYPVKWDLDNGGTLCDGSDCASLDADMDWQEAYEYLGSDFSGSAVIAVIDTGIDADHPDLNDKLDPIEYPGYDFLDGDSDPKDTYGHGTHVSGIAAGETNNGAGTAGVGFGLNIKIMPLRVCDQNGCPTSAIVNAIYHAADNGADVINLSLGGRFGSSPEEQAINYAWTNGLVVVASSGNDSSGRVSYPAAFANAIAVGSTNWKDLLAPYSNKGNALDVVAPGGDMSRYQDPGGIYSTMPTYTVYLNSFGYYQGYDQLQGTSMAAPQVSGLAALLFAMGGKTNAEIRSIIESTADDLGKAGWDRSFGYGRINAYQAVLAASGGPTPTPTPSETPTEDPTPTPTPTETATPTPTPEPGTMHVGDLDGSSSNQGRMWTASVSVMIHDADQNPVAGATVDGSWSGGPSGLVSCTTNSTGECTLSVSGILKRNGSVTFTVDSVSHPLALIYVSSDNHDPDGDSDGTSITVSKP